MVIITLDKGRAGYPEVLEHLHDPPKQLYWKGSDWNHFNHMPRLAIVGSRKFSTYGKACIEKFVSELAPCGVVIISGLALGADSIAHRAAIVSRTPTIAVLPSPIEQIYPVRHRQLAGSILEQGGALVSEYENGASVRKYHFIARNRIIAALADAILIPEAAMASGSLHTARFALDLGRQVLVVPGNITSSLSAGTNNLLKVGATPVTSTQDIIDALGLEPINAQTELIAQSEEELSILKLLKSGISEGTHLQYKCGLEPSDYLQTMTMLEIQGRIRPLGSDHWAIVR